MSLGAVASLVSRPGTRQFAKFCIVGASSFVIDTSLTILLHYGLHLPLVLALTLAFLVAVCNGFYWNRRWTFRAGDGDAAQQGPKFLFTNLVGWTLNVSITTMALVAASYFGLTTIKEPPADVLKLIALGQGKETFSPRAILCAKICATVAVTAWNFSAAKFWTFRRPANTTPSSFR